MSATYSFLQPLGCWIGLHQVPPPRDPPGPVVASCPCCHRMLYTHARSLYHVTPHPSLLLPSYPRVRGVISSVHS